jgi:hypothetical protein
MIIVDVKMMVETELVIMYDGSPEMTVLIMIGQNDVVV